MFTGIVDHTGIIEEIKRSPRGIELCIKSQFEDLVLGESIAVDGVCLTVTQFNESTFTVEVSPESEKLTICGCYQVETKVNLERAMKASDRFGGHWVSGHVEQMAQVQRITNHDEFKEIWFAGIESSRTSFLTPKGSITVCGVSLTINEVVENSFSVMLIPHTLERTNLSSLTAGQRVNIECDWMAKVVVNEVRKLFKQSQPASMEKFLEEFQR